MRILTVKKSLLVVGWLSLLLCSTLSATPEETQSIGGFIEVYCIKCHGPEKQKGDRRFDTMVLPIDDSATLIQMQDILDILNLGEMPPDDEDTQPEVP